MRSDLLQERNPRKTLEADEIYGESMELQEDRETGVLFFTKDQKAD